MSWPIPEMSDERVLELYQQIVPVQQVDGSYREIIGWKDDDGNHRFRDDPSGLREIAFTWDPQLGDEVSGLVELADIETAHACGYIAFFKPDVGEVLAQIPNKYLERVVAFETSSDNQDIKPNRSGLYQTTKTRLFERG